MRRHKQTIPDTGHCLTLSQMAEGPGPAGMTEAEQLERIAIENRHGDEDGTDWFFRRAMGGIAAYRDSVEAIDDASPTIVLAGFGLTPHYCEVLERNGAITIGLVREALRRGEIHEWPHCERKTEADIALAVERMDET